MERAALPLNQALAYGVQAHGAGGGAAAAPSTCFLYRLSLPSTLLPVNLSLFPLPTVFYLASPAHPTRFQEDACNTTGPIAL